MYNVILPTYNEAKNIKVLVQMIHEEFLEIATEYKIVIVDDNSSDGTSELAESLSNTYSIHLVKREKKLGLASAYSIGLRYCNYDYVFVMDADLSHDPKYLSKFINMQRRERCDIVIGTRYKKGGVYGWTFFRKVMSRGANNLAQVILGMKASDVTGSYRLYRRSILDKLLSKTTSIGYSVQMEIMYLAEINNLKIAEIPIVFVNRINGKSKCTLAEVIYFVLTILVLFSRP